MSEVLRIHQLDPGDENCENFAFIPYPHNSPRGILHVPRPTQLVRLRDVTERGQSAFWSCDCGAVLSFSLPLDSDLEG